MKTLIIIFSLFISLTAKAQNYNFGGDAINNADQLWQYRQLDRFQWSNTDDISHVLAGFSISFVTSYALERYTNLSPLEAALAGFALGTLVGVSKEVFIDSYTSRTDIKTWMGGAALGTISFTLLQF